jgi:hypothetical protein
VIVVSLLLILVSGVLLVAGILRAEDSLVITSIGASLLAAAALFMGIRMQRGALARRLSSRGAASPPASDPLTQDEPAAPRASGRTESATAAPSTPAEPPSAGRSLAEVYQFGGEPRDRVGGSPALRSITAPEEPPPTFDEVEDVDDPADEPAAELVMSSEVSRLAELDTEVLVIDGRPRYHLRTCTHLADKPGQALPVSEAIELGFTPCSECAAATTLLAQVPRK